MLQWKKDNVDSRDSATVEDQFDLIFPTLMNHGWKKYDEYFIAPDNPNHLSKVNAMVYFLRLGQFNHRNIIISS